MPAALSRSITFHVPDYLWAAIDKKARAERRSIGNMLRVILEESLEAPVGDFQKDES